MAQALPLHDLIDREGPAYIRANAAGAERMGELLKDWASADPDRRQTRKLLAGFITWNIVMIFFSLVGFLGMHWLTPRPWLFSLLVWIAATGTVVATSVMLFEVGGEFRARKGIPRWLITWLRQ